VVGAGASGMTIAAALAKKRVNVTVLEELQDSLELHMSIPCEVFLNSENAGQRLRSH